MDANTIYDAAVSGDVSRVDALLKQAPELVNAADPYGFTPLHGAVGEEHVDMVRLLIALGADVNARNDRFGDRRPDLYRC